MGLSELEKKDCIGSALGIMYYVILSCRRKCCGRGWCASAKKFPLKREMLMDKVSLESLGKG